MLTPRTRPWLVGVAAAGLLAGSAVLTTSAGAAEAVARVSVSTTGEQADGASETAVISGDGRYVAFTSFARNLTTPGKANFTPDVFLRDRVANTTELVSVGAGGVPGGAISVDDISHDGRYVVFTSAAANLVANDFNGVSDVFIRDRVLGTTERVSVAGDESQAQQRSSDGSVTRDGRYVVFTSLAPLASQDGSFTNQDVYVRDRVAGTTELVSITRKGAEGGGQLPSISDLGRFVSFTSKGKNLVKKDKNRKHDIFVRDLSKDKTERVSVSSKGDEAAKRSLEAQIAGQGRFVVFTSEAGNLVEKDKNKRIDVFVHDRKKDKTELVSVDSRGRNAGGPSISPSISANGRFVSFNSAPDLRKGGRNADALYLHDRSTGKTDPLVPEIGVGATISADGHAVAFNAFRSSVVDGDTNNSRDVFVLTW
jgi:Tol biopolymer transport system component